MSVPQQNGGLEYRSIGFKCIAPLLHHSSTPVFCASQRFGQRREYPAAHPELAVLNLVFVLVQPARRRAGSMGTILIKCAAVAGAHEQMRFFEPANRTAQVRAIYCEYLKRFAILPPHPARNVCRCSIPRTREGITIRCHPRLVFRKVFHRAESDPGLVRLSLAETGENVANHRNGEERSRDGVKSRAQVKKKAPPGNSRSRRTFRQQFLF